jgi:hypothetical protein
MLFDVILKRLWRERRAMAVLFGALVLVCAFMSLRTLYIRAIAESEFTIRLENLRPNDFQIEIRNPQPIVEEAGAIFDDSFGSHSRLQTTIKSSTEGAMSNTPSDTFQPFVYAYRDFDQLFTLVDGRLPEANDNPDVVEVVLTDAGAETLERFIRALGGQQAVIGFQIWTSTVSLEIVGIVSSVYPFDDPYWNPSREYLAGERLTTGNTDSLFITPITSEAIFIDKIAPNVAARFSWLIDLNPELVSVANINTLNNNITQLERNLQVHHPNVTVLTTLKNIIADFNNSIRQTEIPVFFLSTAILVLLLYSLLTINTLLLENQRTEWAIITSRGGSVLQLMLIHAGAMFILAIGAVLVAPFVAQGMLAILSVVGPQSAILDAPKWGHIPPNAFLDSALAGGLAVIFLTLSGLSIARAGLLSLKQSVSRPPTQPTWARLKLDVILLFLGVAFMIRLYLIVGDSASPLDLVLKPANFIQAIAQQGSDSLNDPFNSVAPILFLAGATLLWMRLFPYLIQAVGAILNRSHNFLLRLAFWNVEREPSHYAQIVLLLIGTLAMGVIALSIANTRASDAWEMAYHQTGADAIVLLEPQSPDLDWGNLPNVVDYQVMTQSVWESFTPTGHLNLFGIADDESRRYTDNMDVYPALTVDGIPLPDHAKQILLDVFVEPSSVGEATITHGLTALLRMSNGAPINIPLETNDHTKVQEWVIYQADLSQYETAGWALIGFSFEGQTTQRGTRTLDQAVTLDHVRVETDNQQIIPLESFETDGLWERKTQSGTTGGTILSLDNTSAHTTDGQNALRLFIQFSTAIRANPPQIQYRVQPLPAIPMVISSAYAEVLQSRIGQTSPIAIGDTLNIDFSRRRGMEGITNRLQFDYVVVGIVDDYLSMPNNALFMIARENDLLITLNQSATPNQFYDTNRVWLTLNDLQPTPELREALADHTVDYAWTRYSAIQREPLPNAVTGMLFVGFWVSLGLILIDFAFYLAINTRRRASSFAVLEALGWETRDIWRLLIVEQIIFITPALIVGTVLGLVMAYFVLPFVALGTGILRVPVLEVAGLLVILVVSFTVLLSVMARRLRQIDPTQTFRHNN